MELVQGLHNISTKHHGCVLTIGNFDGVHLGHKEVLAQVNSLSEKYALPAVVMVFEPQPKELFMKHKAPARLCSIREKYTHLKLQKLDRMVCVNFNEKFANLSADDFINLLHEKLGVKHLIVGDDFQFGRDREGGYALLQKAGKELGFSVSNTQSFVQEQLRVSSTAIRDALNQGDLKAAHTMLGRPFSILGRVSHGNKLGRTIGFPTANIPLKRACPPLKGVFVVRVNGAKDNPVNGIANIGKRPTIDGDVHVLEVHLFNFQADIYGLHIEVEVLEKLRDERKFDDYEQLKKQIEIDAQHAREWFINSAL